MNLILPKLTRVKLIGYNPIFKEEIEFNLTELFILLGGNGLGKTTILQSVVYALAGPANNYIESEKTNRWGKDYFKARLENSKNASIQIWFNLGEDLISLKRGFSSNEILQFEHNDELITDKKSEASNFFEQYITECAGYNSIQDFNFMIHKLCYLSEKRESLVWDLDNQTRLLMRIVSDANKEIEFTNKRKLLKNIDSKERHLGVEFNKLDKRIRNAESKLLETEKQVESKSTKSTTKEKTSETKITKLQNDIINLKNIIKNDKKILDERKIDHNSVVNQIEKIREKLSLAERNFFIEHLNSIESNESKLAIYKLINHSLCPSCGSKSEELQKLAKHNLEHHKCVLCGTDEIIEIDEIEADLNTQLADLLDKKIKIEQLIIDTEKRIRPAQSKISSMEFELNNHLLDRKSVVIYVNKDDDDGISKADIENLKKARSIVDSERKNKVIEFNKLQEELETAYSEFNSINNERISKLSELYKKYASEFLGTDCTLEKGDESGDNFLNIRLLVPKFNGILRTSQDSCSEAQRFFLDIALRMSLIELSNSLSAKSSTFICETPESALDITYINNVSDMFKSFSFESGNSILMSSNIQAGGIAQSLLNEIKPLDKKYDYFLNMVSIGELSNVQSSPEGMRLLKEEIEKIIQN